jgi:LmbE family N-acetylglucosaminyl deacetylase
VVLDALYPYARDHLAYPDLLDEGLEPHKVREVWFWGTDEINHRADVTDTFERKLAALKCHASQIREFRNPDLEKWLRSRCKEMAADGPFQLAEGFHRVVIPG